MSRKFNLFIALVILASNAMAAEITCPPDLEVPCSPDLIERAQKSVRIEDARDKSIEAIRDFAANASNERMVINLYGADNEMLLQAQLAGYAAKQKGMDVAGIVVGPTDAPRDFDVIADGRNITEDVVYAEFIEAGMTFSQMLENSLIAGHDYLLEI